MWDGKTERRSTYPVSNGAILEAVLSMKEEIGKANEKLSKFETQVFDPTTGIISMVKDHDKVIYGNGHPGLLKDFNDYKSTTNVEVEDLKNKIDKVRCEGRSNWKQITLAVSITLIFAGLLGWILDRTVLMNRAIQANGVAIDENGHVIHDIRNTQKNN